MGCGWQPLLVLLSLVDLVHPFTAFKPKCSLPPHSVSYVSHPLVRGTLEIVWTCLIVLILCTWSVQHLSVPVASDGTKPTSRTRRFGRWLFSAFAALFGLKRKQRLWDEFFDEVRWNWDRTKWMIAILLAPEYYFGKGLTENTAANESRKQFDDEGWTTMHGFFANMRGFVMRFETTAVHTTLLSGKPSEPGRALAKPRPSGIPTTYYPQDLKNAALIEVEHCQVLCGEYCPFRVGSMTSEESTEHRPVLSPIRKFISQTAAQRSLSDGAVPNLAHIGHKAMLGTFDTALLPVWSNLESSLAPAIKPAPVKHANFFSQPPTRSSTYRSLSIAEELSRAQTIELQSEPDLTPHLQTSNLSAESLRSATHATILPHEPWIGKWALSAPQLYYAQSVGLIPRGPFLSSEELKNQSKTDPMVKLLTMWQIIWLVIQILARSARRPALSTTLIEVTVLAFAATALATYIVIWHKPQDVKVPTYIDALRPITREDVVELAARAPLSTMVVHEFWLHGVAVRTMGDGIFPVTRGIKMPRIRFLHALFGVFRLRRQKGREPSDVGKDHEDMHQEEKESPEDDGELYMNPIPVGMGVGGAIFGSIRKFHPTLLLSSHRPSVLNPRRMIHPCLPQRKSNLTIISRLDFAAWNFNFPTPVERLLWRISCGILVGLPALMVGIYSGYMHYTKRHQGKKREDSKVNTVLLRCGEGLVPIYLLARLYLLVETLRSLAYAKPDAFQAVDWPSAIPHYM